MYVYMCICNFISNFTVLKLTSNIQCVFSEKYSAIFSGEKREKRTPCTFLLSFCNFVG